MATTLCSRRGMLFGNAAFLYTVTDSHGAIGYGTVNLEVLPTYHLPIAISDSGLTMLQDTTLDIDPALLLANDIDPDGNPLTFLGFADGPVTLLDNGFYRVTPAFNYSGPLVLTYSIENGRYTGFHTVTIDVQHVEHSPTAVDDALSMVEDQPIVITVSDLLANDYDLDSQAISVTRLSPRIMYQ